MGPWALTLKEQLSSIDDFLEIFRNNQLMICLSNDTAPFIHDFSLNKQLANLGLKLRLYINSDSVLSLPGVFVYK